MFAILARGRAQPQPEVIRRPAATQYESLGIERA
jgi:hypothetical protein